MSVNNKLLCEMIKKLPKDCVMVGDFNFSDIDWQRNSCSAKSRQFLDTVHDLFFVQMLDFSTHSSGTMPDLVLTDTPNRLIDIEDLGPLGSSDHSMLKVNLKLNTVKMRKNVRVRDWRKANFQMISESVKNVDWENHLTGKDTQQAWDTFLEHLDEEVENAVPWRTIKDGCRPMWMKGNPQKEEIVENLH